MTSKLKIQILARLIQSRDSDISNKLDNYYFDLCEFLSLKNYRSTYGIHSQQIPLNIFLYMLYKRGEKSSLALQEIELDLGQLSTLLFYLLPSEQKELCELLTKSIS